MFDTMVWFDFGGVLSPPMADLYAAYERKTGVRRDQLERAMHRVAAEFGQHPLAALELARITESEWGRMLAAALAADDPGIDLSRCRLETFGAQWFDGIAPNTDMIETLCDLREQGYRVGILTNNVIEWEPYWRAIVGSAGPVEAVVDSCRVGFRKPQAEIFRLAVSLAGVRPQDCVLVDDVAENCTAARSAGWQAVEFRTNAETRTLLSDILSLERT